MSSWQTDSSIGGMVALIFMFLKISLFLIIWKGRKCIAWFWPNFIEFKLIFQRRFHHSPFIFQENGNNLFIIWYLKHWNQVQFSSVAQSCPTLCNPMNHSTPGLPVHHQLLESTQTHVHWVGDAIQPSHPLSFPSPPALNLSQHQGLFQCPTHIRQKEKRREVQLLKDLWIHN